MNRLLSLSFFLFLFFLNTQLFCEKYPIEEEDYIGNIVKVLLNEKGLPFHKKKSSNKKYDHIEIEFQLKKEVSPELELDFLSEKILRCWGKDSLLLVCVYSINNELEGEALGVPAKHYQDDYSPPTDDKLVKPKYVFNIRFTERIIESFDFRLDVTDYYRLIAIDATSNDTINMPVKTYVQEPIKAKTNAYGVTPKTTFGWKHHGYAGDKFNLTKLGIKVLLECKGYEDQEYTISSVYRNTVSMRRLNPQVAYRVIKKNCGDQTISVQKLNDSGESIGRIIPIPTENTLISGSSGLVQLKVYQNGKEFRTLDVPAIGEDIEIDCGCTSVMRFDKVFIEKKSRFVIKCPVQNDDNPYNKLTEIGEELEYPIDNISKPFIIYFYNGLFKKGIYKVDVDHVGNEIKITKDQLKLNFESIAGIGAGVIGATILGIINHGSDSETIELPDAPDFPSR